jgi:damage-control phosphatase, subfamily III
MVLIAPAAQRPPADELASYFSGLKTDDSQFKESVPLSLDVDESPFASTAPSSSQSTHPDEEFDNMAPINKVTLSLGNMPSRKELAPTCPRTPSRIDPNNPPWPAYRGYHEFSFAHATMGVRLPTILGKAIEDVIKTLNSEWEVERIEDLVQCVHRMEVLMENLSGNQ